MVSVTPHLRGLNSAVLSSAQALRGDYEAICVAKNHAFFDPDQTLMPQLRFLDSTKPDKYGPARLLGRRDHAKPEIHAGRKYV
jgi:hypothetical protein